MPENIFQLIAPDILNLHRQTAYSLLALPSADNGSAQIHHAAYVHLAGYYYVWLPENSRSANPEMQTGIFLIETDNAPQRLSWIIQIRCLKTKDSLYQRAQAALRHKLSYTRQQWRNMRPTRLLELTPLQGRFSQGIEQDIALSPADLAKALYPTNRQPTLEPAG